MELVLDSLADDVYPSRLLGRLFIDGELECFTREKPLRPDRVFIAGESALPAGPYNVSIARSSRYGKALPMLASTRAGGDDRRSARIGMFIFPGHSHNVNDSAGDLVLGQQRIGETISHTRPAFEAFFAKLKAAVDRGEAVNLEIRR